MQTYDVVIIGSGVTGLGAAMYAGRLGMKTLVIGEQPGGTITTTNIVENYPGFKRLTGQELADNLREHALDYKEFVSIADGRVSRIAKRGDLFEVEAGESYATRTVIFATGTRWRELKVPGHDEYKNKGVHYCALCDAFFYRGKTVCIVGGSDAAAKDALVLAEHASKVYIIYRRDKLRAEAPNLRRVEAAKNIEVIYNTNIIGILGDSEKGVTSIVLDNPYQGNTQMPMDGVFVAIGHIALSDVAKDAGVALNEKGEIIISRKAETNIPGFFAAGDVVDTHFKQAITGVAEGVTAAYSAYEYVSSRK
jgi:thioredoxin reductase (NADPH)